MLYENNGPRTYYVVRKKPLRPNLNHSCKLQSRKSQELYSTLKPPYYGYIWPLDHIWPNLRRVISAVPNSNIQIFAISLVD